MSNETEKTAIANIGLLSVGESLITSLTQGTPHANKINSIFENIVKELLADDWFFSRKRVHLDDLTQVFRLTVDTSPSPAAFVVGATLTGVSSSVKCTVVEVLSSTVYLVTEPTGDFTDGEVIGDGTNTVDCAANYPTSLETLAMGSYDYGYQMPTDYQFSRGLGDEDYDKLKYPYTVEGRLILTNYQDAFWHYNKWIGYEGSTTISDVTVMPLWFHRLISARLAQILSPNITENARRETKAEIELKEAWLYAREQNGQEAYNKYEGNTDWADGANRELG